MQGRICVASTPPEADVLVNDHYIGKAGDFGRREWRCYPSPTGTDLTVRFKLSGYKDVLHRYVGVYPYPQYRESYVGATLTPLPPPPSEMKLCSTPYLDPEEVAPNALFCIKNICVKNTGNREDKVRYKVYIGTTLATDWTDPVLISVGASRWAEIMLTAPTTTGTHNVLLKVWGAETETEP